MKPFEHALKFKMYKILVQILGEDPMPEEWHELCIVLNKELFK